MIAVEPVIPRARPAGGPFTVSPHAAPLTPPGVPAPPLTSLVDVSAIPAVVPDSAAVPDSAVDPAAPLPVLAPRPRRRRLARMLRRWLPDARRGRHRTGAPHIKAAWSMFAPHRRPRRRGLL